jgi:hypothetical protein
MSDTKPIALSVKHAYKRQYQLPGGGKLDIALTTTWPMPAAIYSAMDQLADRLGEIAHRMATSPNSPHAQQLTLNLPDGGHP